MNRIEKKVFWLVILVSSIISIFSFVVFYLNGLNLAYNDARSHLDIARRVVDNIEPGIAQLGSVWLPLPHILMLPTIWNDWMWHSGLSGAIISMISYVVTCGVIFLFLKELNVKILGRLVGVFLFGLNLNILYLQTTAMTELLLIALITTASYLLIRFVKYDKLVDILLCGFVSFLASLTRYDAWFFVFVASIVLIVVTIRRHSLKKAQGIFWLYSTLSLFGIFLWLLWNLIIFKDPFYFAFGQFSAHSQQLILEGAGVLNNKGNLFVSASIYLKAAFFNTGISLLVALFGVLILFFDHRFTKFLKFSFVLILTTPLLFNIISLYLGHSVIFLADENISWFNVRYGAMLIPSSAILAAYVFDIAKKQKVLLFLLIFSFYFIYNYKYHPVTIEDGVIGSSKVNTFEISNWLSVHAKNEDGLVLSSVGSHDAIMFSSGLDLSRYIHEGTGQKWDDSLAYPENNVKWIIVRTYDNNDLVYRDINKYSLENNFVKVLNYPFADIYERKDVAGVKTE